LTHRTHAPEQPRTLVRVPRSVWQAQAAEPRSIFESRRWLAASEWPGGDLRYVVADDARAMVPARLVTDPLAWPNMNLVDVCAGAKAGVEPDPGDVDEARRAATPHLLVAAPGYETRLVGRRSTDAAHSVVDAVEREGSNAGAVIAFAYLPPDGVLLEVLRRRGYVDGLVSATTWCALPPGGFTAYLERLPAKRRSEAGRERRVFARHGGTLRVLCGGKSEPFVPTLAELEAALQRTHGNDVERSQLEDQALRFLAEFGSDMYVVVGDVEGRAAACATAFRHGDSLLGRSVGLDPELARGTLAYFNVVYYGVIELAYRLGVRRVSFGISSLEAKVRRGASLVPLRAALHPNAPPVLESLLAATDRRLRETLP
jgi:predicted N-acyltransferase